MATKATAKHPGHVMGYYGYYKKADTNAATKKAAAKKAPAKKKAATKK